jgi:long-chain acyl-CoA synthetase
VLEFFDALGMPICEVWGMSETSCIVTTNRPGATRFGSVGQPLDGMELWIADDGELLVRGALVMAGYGNRPDLTAAAIDADGWLHTGDIARIDDDGYVWIVDRKKELIINAAAKNMSPANIEARLKSSGPLIGQACVVGDRRPYNVALLVFDPTPPPASIPPIRPSSPACTTRSRPPTRTCRGWSRSSASACCPSSGCRAATS